MEDKFVKERRSVKRKISTGPLRYCCSDPKNNTSTPERLPDSGIIINESPSGVCFIATAPIDVGQSLIINCPWISDRKESGTVRWCKPAAVNLWRIGFQKLN